MDGMIVECRLDGWDGYGRRHSCVGAFGEGWVDGGEVITFVPLFCFALVMLARENEGSGANLTLFFVYQQHKITSSTLLAYL